MALGTVRGVRELMIAAFIVTFFLRPLAMVLLLRGFLFTMIKPKYFWKA